MEWASTYHFILKVLGGSKTIIVEIFGIIVNIVSVIKMTFKLIN